MSLLVCRDQLACSVVEAQHPWVFASWTTLCERLPQSSTVSVGVVPFPVTAQGKVGAAPPASNCCS